VGRAVARQPAQRMADETMGHDMLYSSGTTGRAQGRAAWSEPQPIDADNPLFQITRKLYEWRGHDLPPHGALYHAAPLRFNMTVMKPGARPR